VRDRILADAVVLGHALYVVFVIGGGFLALRWRWIVWLHIPAALWGVAIEFGGWICPLTPLENALRARAGEAGYGGDFIEHYVLHTLYPHGLTRAIQYGLGAFALAVNVVAYTLLIRAHRRATRNA
jgi:hypothetical protein